MSKSKSIAFAGLWIALASSAVAEAQYGERFTLLERLRKDDLRVGSLAYRLVVANSARCARQMPATGLILHSIDQYRGTWRIPAMQLFGTIGATSVEGIVSQSPAELAGVKPGDELIAINGKQLGSASRADGASTTRRDQAEEALLSQPERDPIRLTFVRAGVATEIELRPVPACRSRFEVVAGSARFARTDGQIIQLGQELIRTLSDEDIAFVISHELAHSILDHRTQLAALEGRGRSRASAHKRNELAREFEDQADRLSVRLLAQAGFDPRAAPRFMRRHGKHPNKASTDSGIHRPARERAELMDAEIVRLKPDQGG